jgi:hypothetical protein
MKAKRRTEIKMESFERTEIHIVNDRQAPYCDSCKLRTAFLSLNEVSTALGMPAASVIDLADSGRLHSRQNSGGATQICLDSLSRYLGESA